MGYYVNPPNESKEEFLEREGEVISFPLSWNDVPDGQLPVILVNNGVFTAAAIAYDSKELAAFSQPSDRRPKKAYLVEIEKLIPVSDIGRYFKNKGH